MESKSFKEINLKNEQKYASYLMRNPKESLRIGLKCILNINIRNIVQAIQKLSQEDLSYTHDELLIFLSEIDTTITKSQLEELYNAFIDFDNIQFIREKIHECYIKSYVTKSILEDILVNVTKSGDYNIKKLKELGNFLIYNASELENNLNIKNSKELGMDYDKTLKERAEGIAKRSLGFDSLNRAVTRPASDGEMTGLVSFKGMAKSIFTKTINNININRKVPVLDLDLEMSQESSVDRFMAMRGGHSIYELMMKNKDERMRNRLIRDLEAFKRNPYYLYYNEPNITLDDFDSIIFKAKALFRESGILKDNEEYIYISVDLLELIRDFSIPTPEKLNPAMNKLHSIIKKHQSHLFFTLQANENKIRSMRFTRPEDLDYYKIGLEDIYGSSVYAGRARVMLSLQRPKHLKYMFFPDRADEWDLEEDIINCNCIKQNDGKLFFQQYVFGNNFKIYPRLVENQVIDITE